MSRAIQTHGGWLLCTVVSTLSLEKSMQWMFGRGGLMWRLLYNLNLWIHALLLAHDKHH